MPANADGISVSAISHEVLRELPHDAKRFTQGLAFRDGRLFESGGLYAQSALFETDLRSNRLLRSRRLPREIFGEGLALHDGQLHVLSWREQRGFVFDPSLKLLREFRYQGEGWGLASDGRQLIRSDGSSTLRFMDAQTHRELRQLEVTDRGTPLTQLNELEFARGWVLANIWYSDRVAVIDPADGHVRGWLDFGALRQRLRGDALSREAVLNGLAYDAHNDVLYVTGKLWPRLFAVRVAWPAPENTANPIIR